MGLNFIKKVSESSEKSMKAQQPLLQEAQAGVSSFQLQLHLKTRYLHLVLISLQIFIGPHLTLHTHELTGEES